MQRKKFVFSNLVSESKKFLTPGSFSPQGEKARLGIEMKSPEKTPHAQIAEELIAIQQRNSKGFRVIDINPNLLPRADFYPQLQQDTIIELFGPESVSSLAAEYEDGSNGATYSSLPYWRTVELAISGNFLKIEHLPVRVNDSRANYQTPGFSQIGLNLSVSDASDSFSDFSPKHSSDKCFLINFQDTKENPIIAKHGDSFKTEFTTVFISFKTTQPRFRVVIGSNSVIDNVDDRLVNMDLSKAPGIGIFNNSFVHPVSFCITERDLNQIQTGSAQYEYVPLLGGALTLEADLIVNRQTILNRCYKAGFANSDISRQQYTTLYQYNNDQTLAACTTSTGTFEANNYDTNGMAVGWLTGFSGCGFMSTAGLGGGNYEIAMSMDLEIIRYAANYTSFTVIKRISSLDGFGEVSGGGAQHSGQIDMRDGFNEPVRFCLMPREALRIVFRYANIQGTANNVYFKFTLNGYMLGTMAGLGVRAGFACAPFEPKLKLTEQSYPLDQSWYGGPRI